MGRPSQPLVLRLSPQFKASAQQLSETDGGAYAGVLAATFHLAEHGRASIHPYVEWGMATSDFRDNSGEIRWPDPEDQSDYPDCAWRGLFVTNPNRDWFLLTLLGNKARYPAGSRAWYDVAVPKSDRIARAYNNVLNLPDFPQP